MHTKDEIIEKIAETACDKTARRVVRKLWDAYLETILSLIEDDVKK
jgi:nucleoid DNA-binding protein